MLEISLPDGSVRKFGQAMTVYEIAKDIGDGLARAALAAEIDGTLVDTSYLIESSCHIRIITGREDEGLEILRHSAAHLLAQSVTMRCDRDFSVHYKLTSFPSK